MKHHLKHLALAGSMLAMAASSVLAGDIKIGSVAGVTGPIAELVVPIIAGRGLAAKHVNAQGGLLKGDQLKLVLSDAACDPKGGVDAGTKVVNVEQVVAIVGASCSGATNGMVQSVTIPAGVVSISDSATAPSITGLKDKDLVFRVAASDAYQGAALAQLAIDNGYKKLAVSYANDDYNSGLAGVFARVFVELGGEVTANQMHEPKKASYRSELATLSGKGEQGLALFSYYGSGGITILRNSLENKLFSKFIGADGMFDKSVLEQIGADNLRGNILVTQATSDTKNESYKLFEAAFKATGQDPQAPYAAHGYDATFLLALAIEKAGAADRGKISAALRAVAGPPGMVIRPGQWKEAKAAIAAGKDINYEGAVGNNDFDKNGDVTAIFSVNVVGDDDKWNMISIVK
jgi:branched-chain amino acid transport system substrate-binding protein